MESFASKYCKNRRTFLGIVFLIFALVVFCLTVSFNRENIHVKMLGHLYADTIVNIEVPQKFRDDILVLTDARDMNLRHQLSPTNSLKGADTDIIISTGKLNTDFNQDKFIKDLNLIIKKDKYDEFVKSCKFILVVMGNKNFYLTPDVLKSNVIHKPRKDVKLKLRVLDSSLEMANKIFYNEFVEVSLTDSVYYTGYKNTLGLNWVGAFKSSAIIFLSLFADFSKYLLSWIFLFLGSFLIWGDKVKNMVEGKFSLSLKGEYIILSVIFGVSLLLRLAFLPDTGISFDDLYSLNLTSAERMFSQNFTDPGNPPLYFLLLKLWRVIFGSSVNTAFILSVIISVTLVFVTYKIARKYFGVTCGLIAALLACISGNMMFYAHTLRVYGLAMIFGLLYMDAFISLLKSFDKQNILKYILITMIYLNLHYYCNMIVALSFVFGLVYINSSSINKLKDNVSFILCNAVSALSFLPYLFYTVLDKTVDKNFNIWIPFVTPNLMKQYIYSFFGDSGIAFAVVLLMVLAAMYLFCNRNRDIEGIDKDQKMVWVYCIYLVLIIPILVYIVSQFKPIAIYRYFSVYYPLLIIFVSSIWRIPVNFIYKKFIVAIFLVLFASAQVSNKYLEFEQNIFYQMRNFMFRNDNAGVVDYSRYMVPEGAQTYAFGMKFYDEFIQEKLDEGREIYFDSRIYDYGYFKSGITEMEEIFNVERIDVPNLDYLFYRIKKQ